VYVPYYEKYSHELPILIKNDTIWRNNYYSLKMSETELQSYSNEEIKNPSIPEKIQEIGKIVETVEEANVETQLDITSYTYLELIRTAKEPVDICVVGSNGMYLLFENLQTDGTRLQILEHRCQRGKNDLDFGLSPEQARRGEEIWNFENWIQNEDKHSGGHGTLSIGDRKAVVDLLQRPKLKGFEWITTKYKGNEIKTMTPEEMIFEKLRSLARSDVERIPIKWGIDIKLLKYYIRQIDNVPTDDSLDQLLSKRWEEYLDSQNNQNVMDILKQKAEGESYIQLIARITRQPGENLVDFLVQSTGYDRDDVQGLLSCENDDPFIQKYLALAKTDKTRMTYAQISEKASNNFSLAMKAINNNS